MTPKKTPARTTKKARDLQATDQVVLCRKKGVAFIGEVVGVLNVVDDNHTQVLAVTLKVPKNTEFEVVEQLALAPWS